MTYPYEYYGGQSSKQAQIRYPESYVAPFPAFPPIPPAMQPYMYYWYWTPGYYYWYGMPPIPYAYPWMLMPYWMMPWYHPWYYWYWVPWAIW